MQRQPSLLEGGSSEQPEGPGLGVVALNAAPAPAPAPALELKICILGDGGTGKSCWVSRLLREEFENRYIATRGVVVYSVPVQTTLGPVIFNLWDVAGQEKYGGLRAGYFCGSHGAIVFGDATSRLTWASMDRWAADFRGAVGVPGSAPIVRVANKIEASDAKVKSRQLWDGVQVSVRGGYQLEMPLLTMLRSISGRRDVEFTDGTGKLGIPRWHYEQQFEQFQRWAYRNEASAEIFAAVEQEPGLVTRGSERKGMTIIHAACAGGHVDLARDLLDRQADVHQRDIRCGFDALMCASISGHIPVIEFLLSRGADMTARDNDGVTALGLAAWYDKLPACKYLMSRGSDLMSKDNFGQTALDIYGGTEDRYGWGALDHYGMFFDSFANPPLSDEQKEQRCGELRAAFADAIWARRWPFMFVVVSCGFRPLPQQHLAGLSLVPQSDLPRREYCLRVILCSDFLLRRIVSFL